MPEQGMLMLNRNVNVSESLRSARRGVSTYTAGRATTVGAVAGVSAAGTWTHLDCAEGIISNSDNWYKRRLRLGKLWLFG